MVGEEVLVMIGLGIRVVFGWVGSVMIGGVMRIFVLSVMDVIRTLGGFLCRWIWRWYGCIWRASRS